MIGGVGPNMYPDPILATEADAAAIAAVRVAAADRLTLDFGEGHWSSRADERSVLRELTSNQIIIVRSGDEVVGTASLQKKKPWAIDLAYFTACGKPDLSDQHGRCTHALNGEALDAHCLTRRSDWRGPAAQKPSGSMPTTARPAPVSSTASAATSFAAARPTAWCRCCTLNG